MEAQPLPVFGRNVSFILVREYPAAVGSGKFQLVAVVAYLFRTDYRLNLRHIKMPNSHQLVIDLLPFCLKLKMIGKQLPFAASTQTEMTAERFLPVRGGLYNPDDTPFGIILLFLCNQNVHDISRHGVFNENDSATRAAFTIIVTDMDVGNCLAFCGNRFDADSVQYY